MASLQLILSPHVISWSRNPVSFRFKATPYLQQERENNTAVRLTLLVESAHYNNNWQEIKTQIIRPNAEGYADVDFSRLLDAQLEWDFPAMDGNVQLCKKQIRRYKVRYALIDDYGQAQNAEETTPLHVLKGGLSAANWHRDRFFTDYADTPRFLTWMHATEAQSIAAEQSEFLYFLAATAGPGFAVTRSVGMDDNSFVVSTKWPSQYPASTQPWQLFCIRNSLAIAGVATPTGRTAISLRTLVGLNQPCRKTSRINLLPTADETRTMMWRSSLGGIDTHVFTGLAEHAVLVQKEAVSRIDSVQFFKLDNERPSEFFINVKHWNKRRLNTGWISRLAIDNMRDLLNSSFAYENRGGQWVPVKIDAATTVLYTNRDGLYNLTVEVFDAIAESSYTPEDYSPTNDSNPVLAYLLAEQTRPATANLTWKLPNGYNDVEIQYSPVQGYSSLMASYNPPIGSPTLSVKINDPALNSSPFQANTWWRARVVLKRDVSGTVFTAGGWTAWQLLVVKKTLPPIARTVRLSTTQGAAQRKIGDMTDLTRAGTSINGGSLIASVSANGDKGGAFTINGAGDILYTPVSAGFSGVETVPYSLAEIVTILPVVTSPLTTDRLIVTVDNAGGVGGVSGMHLPYIKLEIRSHYISFDKAGWVDWHPDFPPTMLLTYAKVFVSFWKDATCTTKYDLTGSGISISVQNDLIRTGASTPFDTNVLQAIATGTEMDMGEMLAVGLDLFSPYAWFSGFAKLLPSQFYIIL